jgi:hypothetical protein
MKWIKQMFTRRRRYDELSESIREHLDEKIEDLIDRGMTREEAERKTHREFGNVTLIEQRSREVWQWPTLESLCADTKYTLRRLRRAPLFTTIALITLAIAVGANTVIFTVVNGVLLKPLSYPNPDRLIAVDHLSFPPPTGLSVSFYQSLHYTPSLMPLEDEVVGNVQNVLWVLLRSPCGPNRRFC